MDKSMRRIKFLFSQVVLKETRAAKAIKCHLEKAWVSHDIPKFQKQFVLFKVQIPTFDLM